MECPFSYQSVITKGNLVLKYFSKAINGSCCWYALKQPPTTYEILTSAEKQEIIAVYRDGQLIFLNKIFLKAPVLMRNAL
jgi:hypothetical protein